MAVSKLFTPVLRAAQPTAIQAKESAPMFVNPPTHPETPIFSGPADTDGKACYPLRLNGDRQASTKTAQTYPVTVRDDIDPE